MRDTRPINRLLGQSGLAQLGDPGLIPQLACLVRDHAHFRSLLITCEPEERRAMYEAMAPNLSFQARSLDAYLTEAREDAAARQLPTVAPDGTLQPYRVPEVGKSNVAACSAPGVLGLLCPYCDREQQIQAKGISAAVEVAIRDHGWTRLPDGRAVCSDPVGRIHPDHPHIPLAETDQIGKISKIVQTAVDEHLLPKHLTVTCAKCTREATFHGVYCSDTIEQARKAGWVYQQIDGKGREICPNCVL